MKEGSATSLEKVAFGGGCHWCTEAVFQQLRGVHRVEQGFVRSDPPNDSWSEAVVVSFDPEAITLAKLIAVHVSTHASTSNHSMRGKYRSAVYSLDEQQHQSARLILGELQHGYDNALVTQVLPYRDFKFSDTRFHNYYASDNTRPFCKRYIAPKMDKLNRSFRELLRDDSPARTRKH